MKNLSPCEDLIATAQAGFAKAFGYQSTSLYQAPGRVNLLGEHTDYNECFVLPCAINYHIVVAAAPREDNTVRIVSLDYEAQQDSFSIDEDFSSHPNYGWANYVRGVVKCLSLRSHAFSGADLVICGNVPQGAGVSSSAALEVAIGQTFKELYDLPISQQDIALIGQEAENQFVGMQCGIMDQLIVAKGEADHALLIDCRSLHTSAVKIPDDLAVVIINSNVMRRLVEGAYNVRRTQCEAASKAFGVSALRDVTPAMLEDRFKDLDAVVAKRARHVITESKRTELTYEALGQGDLPSIAHLMAESHASMRDDFEITVEPIDFLVELIPSNIGSEGGARMTGGGFGGCVVALMPEARVADVCDTIAAAYEQHTGIKETIYVCHASPGAGPIA